MASAPSLKSSRLGGVASRRSPSGPPPVEVNEGLAFRWSGYDCVVSEVNDQGAIIVIGATRLTVEFGERVTVMGNYRTLSPIGGGTVNESRESKQSVSRATDAVLREDLKKWRRGQASSEGVPAFVVFYDTTLDELCEKLPQTLSELRRVKGFGPIKVEKYGDSVLSIISEHLA